MSLEKQLPVRRFAGGAKAKEKGWVDYSTELLDKEDLNGEDKIMWSAYHAVWETLTNDPPVTFALLPLFYEKASTPAMIKHGMDVLKKAIKFLNPAQIPVMTVDQPLFALAKMVQWKWLGTHGED